VQIPVQQIIEGIIVVTCSAIIFLKNNGILKEIKSRNYSRLEKRFDEQRLDLLKYGIYVTKIPMLDKLYNFNEYIASGGNHGVIEHMKPIILRHQDDWWTVYNREKDRVVADERYRDYYNNVIAEIKAYILKNEPEKPKKKEGADERETGRTE